MDRPGVHGLAARRARVNHGPGGGRTAAAGRRSVTRLGVAALLWAWAQGAAAQPALPSPPPHLTTEGRAAYASFLATNLPRAFAVGGADAFGWQGGTGKPAEVQAKALASCTARGAADCRLYAIDLALAGQPAPPPPPGPLMSTWNYSLDPDVRYIWRGPAAAAGVYLWAHGLGGSDSRGLQPQPHVRAFNNAGFDVVRFDRDPNADRDRVRAAEWMADGLALLRSQGYRRVIVGGQSRGAWNALMMLARPGLADAVIAVSPAAHGSGSSTNLNAQYDDLRALVAEARPAPVRVAFVQFKDDLFAGDLAGRRALIERLRPLVAGLLILDQPPGFDGHGAGNKAAFAEQYGQCLLRFALGGPDHC